MKSPAVAILLFAVFTAPISACELCAIYSADAARGVSGSGFVFTIAEQYISAHTLYADGKSASQYAFFNDAFLDSAFTHLVPGYNFSTRFGLSVNVPLIYRDFRRTSQSAVLSSPLVDETGTLFGPGDVALIGRLSLFQRIKMTSSINISLLAGVKLPTGDTARLDDEVREAKADPFASEPGHGLFGGVHQHDLTLGSGSYDAVFGLTPSFRWKRWFVNNQVQYYLRTKARGYRFGDLFIVSGGPGGYVLLGDHFTLSLQANAFYERNARDKILGRTFDQTGMTAWYFGPLINLTLGEHFSANGGVDVPLNIYNHGLQTVPDYRVHGGFTWRF